MDLEKKSKKLVKLEHGLDDLSAEVKMIDSRADNM